MKTITLNHQEIQIQEDCTLARLLEDKGLTGGGIAAAVNNRVIPRKDWDVTLIMIKLLSYVLLAAGNVLIFVFTGIIFTGECYTFSDSFRGMGEMR